MHYKRMLTVTIMYPQGNWNYYAAVRGERKDPKLEATHLEKSKELYGKVGFWVRPL